MSAALDIPAGRDYSNYILPVGGLVLAFFAGREILENIGLIKSRQGAANQGAQLPGSPFDPTFWKKKTPALILGGSVTAHAKNIYDSVSAVWFNDPAVFIGTMQQMQTKAMVSHLADVFQQLYGKGMIAYLSGYLTPDQLAQGIRIAEALPDYWP